jgi:hypothetical protein
VQGVRESENCKPQQLLTPAAAEHGMSFIVSRLKGNQTERICWILKFGDLKPLLMLLVGWHFAIFFVFLFLLFFK